MDRDKTINYLSAETNIEVSRFEALDLPDDVLAGYMSKMEDEHTEVRKDNSLARKLGTATLGSFVATAFSIAVKADPIVIVPAITATLLSGAHWLALHPYGGWNQSDIRHDIARREYNKGMQCGCVRGSPQSPAQP